jgi:hypothetical protein
MSGNWVPVSLFISLAFVVIAKLILDISYKKEQQKTIREALKKEPNVDVEIIKAIGSNTPDRFSDFKKAVTLLMLSIAMYIGTILIGIGMAGFAIATFPLCLSIAFFIIYKTSAVKING